MATRLDHTTKNSGEFTLAPGAEVGYCLAGEAKERLGTVVEVSDEWVTVRDKLARNEVKIGAADSIRVLDVGAREIVGMDGETILEPAAGKPKRPQKVCPDCSKPYLATGNSQKYCAACGEVRHKALAAQYRKQAAEKAGRAYKSLGPRKVAKVAPRGKPVAARGSAGAGRKPVTAADSDKPQPRGGMALVRTPRVPEVPAAPKHAPSTADVTPGSRPPISSFDLVHGLIQQAEKFERLALRCRELAGAL